MRHCRRRSAAFVHAALALTLAGIAPCFARERGPRVDVLCPAPPIPVKLGQRRVLVYELHITNFDSVPLTLKQVEVYSEDESKVALATLEEASLSKAIVHVGKAMAMGDANTTPSDVSVILPGTRVVLYMWVELPARASVPGRLHHRMAFSAPNSSTDATLTAFEVSVGRSAVPILAPPFHGGTWLAGDGPANDSTHRRSILAIDGYIHSPERFAIDWVKVGPNGDSRRHATKTPDDYWGWGEPVLAVADGETIQVVDGFADNALDSGPLITLENIAGNYVVVRIAADRYVAFAHLQNGSIKVRPHQQVHTGDVLALLGNSGNTTGPHLHLQVTDGGSLLQSEGVPFVIPSFTYLGPGSEYELNKHITVRWSDSIPPGDGVLEFAAAHE